MIWSILHRTILWELVRVFALSLLGITGMLLMAGIVQEASQHGLGPMQILATIPVLIPSTLPYTIPATTLFATCVVYGRLAHDNEILAIKAAGINILSVVWPAVFLGLAMTATTVFLFYDIIPSTRNLMRVMVMQDIEEFLYTVLKRDHQINYPGLNYKMAVRKVEGRKLVDAVFDRVDPKTHAVEATALAEEAELHVDLEHKQIRIEMWRCVVTGNQGNNGNFTTEVWPVDLPPDFDKSAKKDRPGEMTWDELLAFRAELEEDKEKKEAEMALVMQLDHPGNVNPERQKHLDNLRSLVKRLQAQILNATTEMLMRPALACGCLCFVIVGCPVAIWFSKSDYLSAFITCFLPIVFLYYPLLLCGTNLAKDPNGRFHPIVAVWCANAIMAAVAVPLYRKLMKN